MQAFVAMPFQEKFWPVWEAIHAACQAAGMDARRVDQLPQVDDIAQAIWRGIQAADLLIADFSGDKDPTIPNPNVVTEAAYARNLKKPMVILTQSVFGLPFDWRTYRVLVYENTQNGLAHLQKMLTENLQGIRENLERPKKQDKALSAPEQNLSEQEWQRLFAPYEPSARNLLRRNNTHQLFKIVPRYLQNDFFQEWMRQNRSQR
jgi:hypothetical protein